MARKTRRQANLQAMLVSSLGAAVCMLMAALANKYFGVDITIRETTVCPSQTSFPSVEGSGSNQNSIVRC